MTVIINGSTGIDTVQDSVITSAKLASGQTLSVNGITFPTTQSASSDANTLDDYEEGTWTPLLTAGTGSLTSYASTGTYVKIGRQVTLNLNYTVTNNGTGAVYGNIGNFPFTVISATGASAVGRIGGTTGSTVTLDIGSGGGNGGALWTYNNQYPWANNAASFMTITYQTS